MRCFSCDCEVEEGTIFCPNCGANLSAGNQYIEQISELKKELERVNQLQTRKDKPRKSRKKMSIGRAISLTIGIIILSLFVLYFLVGISMMLTN